MGELQSAMKSQLESVFNFEGNGIIVTATINLRSVETLKDVSETDHLFTIMNDADFNQKYRDLHGIADVGGLKVMLPMRTAQSIMDGTNREP